MKTKTKNRLRGNQKSIKNQNKAKWKVRLNSHLKYMGSQ